MDDTQERVVELWISWTLRAGVWISSALMIAGLLVAWITGSALAMPIENFTLGELFIRIRSASVDSVTLIFSGLVLLMLTPFLRVLSAVIGFLLERDFRFAVVALIVLGMLLGELFLSLR